VDRAIVVMAKAPIAGLAKTRLQRETGLEPEAISRLANAFLTDVLASCARVTEARTVIAFTPEGGRDFFAAAAPHATLVPQVEGDLGARMRAAFEFAFATGASAVVMIGTDAPHFGATRIRAVFTVLERAPCVIVPADDGGYCAIGLDDPCTGLFANVPWSTSEVLDVTLANATSSGIRVELVPREFDVDTAADLDRLAALLAVSPERAPKTARELRSFPRRGQ